MRRIDVASRNSSSAFTWAAAALSAVAALLLVLAAAHWRSETEVSRPGAAGTPSAPAETFPPASVDGRNEVAVPPHLVDVCGLGRISRQPGGGAYPPTVVSAANAALEMAAAELAASSLPLQQAVGLFVQASLEDRRTGQSPTARALSANLARVAVSSRDPAVYALAFYRCNKAGATAAADASCSLISAANWAQLEPDNAVPWLYLASALRGDERASDEALFRASRARASRLHWNAIAALTESRAIKQQPAETRGLLHAHVHSLSVSFALPDLGPVMSYCSPTRTTDAARRQACSDIATVFADRGTTLVELSVGTRLGARTGWAADRVSALRDRSDAIQAQLSEDPAPNDPPNCSQLAALESRTADLLRYGEVGAAERRIQASGRSVEQLAQQWREGQRTLHSGAIRPPLGDR